MKSASLIISLLALTGCATSPPHKNDDGELKKQVINLQKIMGNQTNRLEELNNKILMLSDRIDGDHGDKDTYRAANQTGQNRVSEMTSMSMKKAMAPVNNPAIPQEIARQIARSPPPEEPDDEEPAIQRSVPPEKTAALENKPFDITDPIKPKEPIEGIVVSKEEGQIQQSSGPTQSVRKYRIKGVHKLYQRAQDQARAGHIHVLERTVELMLKGHKESPLTNNALFLLGETLLDRQQYTKAAAQFERLYKNYPDGNKAVSALFELGICYEKLGKKGQAREVFQDLISIYPGSKEAELAEKRLVPGTEPR